VFTKIGYNVLETAFGALNTGTNLAQSINYQIVK